jgi:hypothetical protein
MKLPSILRILVLLPFLMGAATITLVNTPNPNGTPNQIQGSGQWGLDPNDPKSVFNGLQYLVTLKGSSPPQTTQQTLTKQPKDANWSITLTVAAATYNPCTATLYWIDGKGKQQSATVKNTNDQVVK